MHHTRHIWASSQHATSFPRGKDPRERTTRKARYASEGAHHHFWHIPLIMPVSLIVWEGLHKNVKAGKCGPLGSCRTQAAAPLCTHSDHLIGEAVFTTFCPTREKVGRRNRQLTLYCLLWGTSFASTPFPPQRRKRGLGPESLASHQPVSFTRRLWQRCPQGTRGICSFPISRDHGLDSGAQLAVHSMFLSPWGSAHLCSQCGRSQRQTWPSFHPRGS